MHIRFDGASFDLTMCFLFSMSEKETQGRENKH